jgi:hypothetical protein
MNACPDSGRIQSWLDDELPADEARVLHGHVSACAACGRELALYRRVVRSLEALPTRDPGPAFTARVLDRVLPSRLRRRWLRTLGVGYASALAVTVAAVLAAVAQPGPRALLESISGEIPRRLAQAAVFALNALSFSILGLTRGGHLLAGVGERLAPLGRALGALLSHSAITVPLGVAAVACVAVLWWMGSHERHTGKEVGHVRVLCL